MSHPIKRLSSASLTPGCAGGNFPSTIYAQSSTWGPAATPARAGSPSGAGANKAWGAEPLWRAFLVNSKQQACGRAGLPGAFVGSALELDGAQRKGGRVDLMLLGSVRFAASRARLRTC